MVVCVCYLLLLLFKILNLPIYPNKLDNIGALSSKIERNDMCMLFVLGKSELKSSVALECELLSRLKPSLFYAGVQKTPLILF